MQSETDTLQLYHRTCQMLHKRVRKTGGDYQHTGTVVSVFAKTNGDIRLVIEFDRPTQGMLHILRPDQVELLDTSRHVTDHSPHL